MLIQALAGLLLLALLWTLFRLAMGLRWAKLSREQARTGAEAQGRRVVAEIALGADELVFFIEDKAGFYWAGKEVRKADVVGARILLNGGVIGSFRREGTALPEPSPPEDDEGRERWEVVLYLQGGASARVACGALREGVSRQIAARVFAAVKEAVGPPTPPGGRERPSGGA